MSDFAQVLFQSGRATPLMLARCRAKGALTGLSPNLQLTEKALPTRSFVEWWGRAFPSRQALPAEPLHDAAGHPTIAFHRVFR